MARYWRVVGLRPRGSGSLELSEFQLWVSGSRVDTGASITSAFAPFTGALSDLSDGSTSAVATWTALQWVLPGMFVAWDMGSDIGEVNELRIGTGNSADTSLLCCMLQKSSDGAAWTTVTLTATSLIGAVVYTTPLSLVPVTSSVGTSAMPVGTVAIGTADVVGPLARIPSSYPTTMAVSVVLIDGNAFAGLGYIEVTTAIEGNPDDDEVPDIPVGRLVRLYRDSDGALVKSLNTDNITGVGRFEGINMEHTYTAIAFDPSHSWRAVVADGVVPELMT